MRHDKVLILGARSDIAMAVAHRFAKAGYDIQLAARNPESLVIEKSDLEIRYRVSVSLHEFDAIEIGDHERFVDDLPHLPQVAVCAVGFMGKQRDSELNRVAASLVMRSNYEGPASILALLANRFEQRGSGSLIGISSVAGERGRATNYVYGSAKAGFTAFLSGLRHRLLKKGVHVMTVLPGFVETKMTASMKLPTRLTAQSSELANAIYYALRSKKQVLYYRRVWWFIMFIIRLLPEKVFLKTKL